VPAVMASAVEDALGARDVRVEEMPLTPETLRRMARSEAEG